MKKLCQFTLCLCLCFAAASAFAASSPADSSESESGLVVLEVSKDSVRLRSDPDTESDIVAGLDTGAVVVAEKWPIQGNRMSWYRIVALAGKESGNVTSAMRAFPDAFSYPYVSAELVQPYSGDLSTAEIINGVMATPYGKGYSPLNNSADTQRFMAEHGALKWAFPPATGVTVPVYAESSTNADILGHYSEKTWALVLVDDTRLGWLRIIDLTGKAPSNWVEANRLEVAPRDNTSYGREPGYLVTLGLGANVAEIMRRWGPGTVVERRVTKKDGISSVQTRITAEGFELTYVDCHNFTFTLTRPGAGLGGIFVSTDWYDKEYVQRVFGKLSPEFTSHGGIDSCTIGGGPDGWNYVIHLEFDSKGLISKFSYQCNDVVLN
ncbi:hypothetical protein LJC26_01645 [Desulfovibrio sp. OttesenSCG-928-O18]|nr:hypothetical protein [Desulfovibrio sp. OttesenSCG-928-O18]